jgi:hypothetical protein
LVGKGASRIAGSSGRRDEGAIFVIQQDGIIVVEYQQLEDIQLVCFSEYS